METRKAIEDGALVLYVSGKLNAATAPDFEKAMDEAFADAADELIVDLADVDYLASAGLRVFVSSQKKAQGSSLNLSLRNLQDVVREVFEVTGIEDIFDIS
jgi:anti-anti-sigma factor